MFRALVHRLKSMKTRSRSSAASRRPRKPFRPAVEPLEERRVLSTYTWSAAGDGYFDVASNWSDENGNPGVPGPNDTAINRTNYNITVRTNAVVGTWLDGSGEDTMQSGSSLTITGNGVDGASYFYQLEVQNGATLDVEGNITALQQSTVAGTMNVASGATLQFSSDNNSQDTLNAGAVLEGQGLYQVSDENLFINAPILAPANFELDGTLAVAATQSFTVPSGSTFNWYSGSLEEPDGGAAAVTVQQGANFTLGQPSAGLFITSGLTLTNDGTALWTGDNSLIDIDANDEFINNGSFTMNNNGVLMGTVLNTGTWIKDVDPNGAGLTDVQLPFNNTGTVEVISGTLRLSGDGTSSGSFAVDAGATLIFNSTSYTIAPNSGLPPDQYLSGSGQYEIEAGTLVINANVTVNNLLMYDDLNGTGEVMVTGMLDWEGGAMDGTGSTVICQDAILTVAGADTLYGGWNLTNAGTGYDVSDSSVYLNIDAPSVFTNTGTFTVESSAPIAAGSFVGTVDNEGTWIAANPGGETDVAVPFINNGTVIVQSGTLNLWSPTQLGGDGTLTGGTWTVASQAAVPAALRFAPYEADLAVSTIGPEATVTLSGPDSSLPSLNSLAVNDGFFSLLDGASFQTGGDCTNSGTLLLDALSALAVNGNFATSGTLEANANVEINGVVFNIDYNGGAGNDVSLVPA